MNAVPASAPLPPASAPEFNIDFLYLWQAIRRRRRIVAAVASLAVIVTSVAVLSMRPVYEARAMLLIEKVGQNTLERDSVMLDASQDDYYQTQYAILQSRTLAERVVATMHLERYPEFAGGNAPSALQRAVRIEPLRRTRLVNVNVASRDPVLAAGIANALASGYLDLNLESKVFLSRELLKSLDGRLPVAAMHSLPAVVNSPLVQEMKSLLAAASTERAELSRRYEPAHPRMQQLQARISSLQAQIDREVLNIVGSVRVQLSGEFKGNNVRIVDPAQVPESPSRPRRARAIALALVLGLAVGIGLAILIDRWDLTCRSPDDVEHHLRAPCLSLVQKFGAVEWLTSPAFEGIWRDGRSVAAESFRNLRVAVNFRLASVVGPKALLVTSSVAQEGKSFVAANLARAYAAAGERVLLIDADLRRPSVHRIFGISSEQGLSYFLSNGSKDPVRTDSGVPNLSILPCGPTPDNPSELLHDEKLGRLVEWAVGRYDRIIVDTPPLFPVSDALLWARHVHGVLLVVGAGEARVTLIQRAHGKLKEAFSNVLGVCLNKVVFEPFGYYGASYYGAAYMAYQPESAPPPSAGTPAAG